MAILEAAMGLLTFGAYRAKVKRENAMQQVSPQVLAERAVIYEAAVNHCKDPDKLREMAKAFQSQGHTAEASMLLKRAILRELSPEKKAERKAIYARALASVKPAAIRAVADQFEETGSTGAANKLREHAQAVELMLAEEAKAETPDQPAEEKTVENAS